jgi:hypothetical protein
MIHHSCKDEKKVAEAIEIDNCDRVNWLMFDMRESDDIPFSAAADCSCKVCETRGTRSARQNE